MEISVIVPVYNTEKTLKRCIASLLKQNVENYEIIMIDDGSTDSSPQICDMLAKKYEHKIRIIHKTNGGLGSARNCGIENALGKYICFVDSDDWVEPEYLKLLYDNLNESSADMCICGYNYISKKHIEKIEPNNTCLKQEDILEQISQGNSILNFAWNKLYKLKIIRDNNLKYSNRHCAEDLLFNIGYYRYVNEIKIIENPLYNYWVNIESLTNNRRKNFIEDMQVLDEEYRKLCSVNQYSMSLSENLKVILLRNCYSNYYNASKISYKEAKSYMLKSIKLLKIDCMNVDSSRLSKVDRFLFALVKNDKYLLIHITMNILKLAKYHMFPLYSKIRNYISGTRNKKCKDMV